MEINDTRNRRRRWLPLKLIGAITAGVLVLTIGAAGVYGSLAPEGEQEEPIAQAQAPETDEAEVVESVTMTIELETGGTIDLDVPEADVVIDTWRGDEILVIVEKARVKGQDPVNIRVSRHGKDVRIATQGLGNRAEELRLSFRIVVPESHAWARDVRHNYSLAKLTSVLWRALSKEAVNWIAR